MVFSSEYLGANFESRILPLLQLCFERLHAANQISGFEVTGRCAIRLEFACVHDHAGRKVVIGQRVAFLVAQDIVFVEPQ